MVVPTRQILLRLSIAIFVLGLFQPLPAVPQEEDPSLSELEDRSL